MRSSRARRSAFTLVELLVVIGIIAVLIGILLPVINGARRQARLVQCSSNLRNLVQACQMHAQEHGGYLPLAGYIIADPATGMIDLPTAVGDVRRTRYSYAKATSTMVNFSVIPVPAALGPYLSAKPLPENDIQAMDQALNDADGVWRYFVCPDTTGHDRPKYSNDPNDANLAGQGTMMAISVGPTDTNAWSTNTDYGMNEGVFGYHYDPKYDRNRLRGQLTRVRRSSEVMLFGDAIPRKDPALSYMPIGWICLTPALGGTGAATLGDAFAGNPRAAAPDNFDLYRHSGRMNVAFADGHVATFVLKKEELDQIYLVPPP